MSAGVGAWYKCLMLKSIVPVSLLLACCACVRSGGKPEPVSTRPVRERPAWLKQGVVMVGSWEPLSFILRRGGQETDAEDRWKAERTEHSIRKLKERGVNLVILNFHKGLGLRAEAEDIQATRAFVEIAHRYGIKVGGYVGCTMFHETFFAEEPEARDWMQRDEFGRPIYYNSEQTFRYAACYNHPGHQAFMQKLLRLGIQDLKLDLIHYDGIQLGVEPRSCRCQHCRRQFREFVESRHAGPPLRRARFGFTRLEDLQPPAYDLASGPVTMPELRNPLMQEWALFRCASQARRFAEYDNYARRLNPEVAMEENPNLHMETNMGFSRGVDVAQILDHGDIVWSEDSNHAAWTEDGRVICKVRGFKAAQIMGKSIFVYTGGRYGSRSPDSPPELRLAEAMAYNTLNLGMVGDLAPEGVELTPAAQAYVRFFREHVQDFTGKTSLAEVAVLRSFASVEFNPGRSLVSTMLAEQTLLQSQVPFDIIFDRHLSNLGKYKVLVLANQDALGDAQLAAIREYVNNGGGLVATEETAMLSEWRLRRAKSGLADLFEAGQKAAGKGRVAYIPKLEPVTVPPRPQMSYSFGNANWKLPANAPAFLAAVRWAAGAAPIVAVNAPPSVTLELTGQGDWWLLHLVNFNFRKPATNIPIRVRAPAGKRLSEVVVESPDGGTREVLPADAQGSFRVPRLAVYDLVQMKFQ